VRLRLRTARRTPQIHGYGNEIDSGIGGLGAGRDMMERLVHRLGVDALAGASPDPYPGHRPAGRAPAYGVDDPFAQAVFVHLTSP
jgi:hypothetical protein